MGATRRSTPWTEGARLTLTGAISIALHLVAAYSLGVLPLDDAFASRSAERSTAHPLETQHPWVTLGERQGSPVSLTWITLDEPAPHAATDPSQVTQPRLRTEASAPVQGEPTGRIGRGEDTVVVDTRALQQAVAQWALVRQQTTETVTDRVRALLRPADMLFALLARERAGEAERETGAKEPSEVVEQPAPTDVGGGAPDPGPEADVTDRESDASSEIQALADVIGSDIAGRGITIKTIRPVHSPYVQIMTNPRPAIFEIEWDAQGKGFAILEESSGDATIDQDYKNIISKRWRAEGPAIEALADRGPDARVRVRLKILF